MGDRTFPGTGQRPAGARRGQGEAALSPRRLRVRLRAERAVGLRARGLTYDEIAATSDGEGGQLYSTRRRAHEAVRGLMDRGAILSAEQLLRAEPGAVVDVTPELLERVTADLLALQAAVSTRPGLTTEQRGAVAGALIVAQDLMVNSR